MKTFALLLILVTAFTAAETFRLWGERGERWTTHSWLPDFSCAGYQRGEKLLPTTPPGVGVNQFGAKGKEHAADAAAFQKALARVKSRVIEVPPGR